MAVKYKITEEQAELFKKELEAKRIRKEILREKFKNGEINENNNTESNQRISILSSI